MGRSPNEKAQKKHDVQPRQTM